MLVIVDYGLGNLGSVANMLRRLDVPARVSSAPADVLGADALILPGVGAFDVGMKNLADRGLVAALQVRVGEGRAPILGICLGMQLLTRGSEEGSRPGLGYVPATTKRFVFEGARALPVPHMGWNDTRPLDGTLFRGLDEPRFYYVHSYHVVCDDAANVAATCTYGFEFTAAIRHGNVFGTQFHPEKSHKYGMGVLANFVEAVRRG
jgi:imidazole glycerol-phosphate synthase subunit HisH